METKSCPKCASVLAVEEFRLIGRRRQRLCVSCERTTGAEYGRKIREAERRLRYSNYKAEFNQPDEKICDTCNSTLLVEAFALIIKRTGTKLRSTCKSCWAKKPRDSSGSLIRSRDRDYHKKQSAKHYEKHKVKILARAQEKYRALRHEVLCHYASAPTPNCSCCGESHYEFLAIDHINGGGTKHRKGRGAAMMAIWLKKNNFPEGFRVLCHNCNLSRGFYGFCPHENDKKNTDSVNMGHD